MELDVKQVFVTTYREGPWELGSEILARDVVMARAYAKLRGLRERVRGTLAQYPRIQPQRRVSEVLADKSASFPEKIHAACWLARLDRKSVV